VQTWCTNMRFCSQLTALALLACALQVPAYAGIFDDDEARKAILELRERNAKSQEESDKRYAELARRIERLDQLTDRLEKASRAQLELNNDIAALRQEIARLRGQVEVQANDTSRLQKELSTAQTQQRTLASTVDDRLKRMEPIQVTLDGSTVSVEPREKQLFDAGLNAFKGADYKGALTSLTRLNEEYPQTAYQANAWFWSASALFALKDYKAAIATHERMLKRYPEHARSADAMLNMAVAQIESSDKRNGRRSLELVIERFPQSPAATSARDRLSRLK
jgi:tol-pal system protein YbgF